jgi:hypothetical protein
MFRVRVDPGGGKPERLFEFIALPFWWSMSGYWFVRLTRIHRIYEERDGLSRTRLPRRLFCCAEPGPRGHGNRIFPSLAALGYCFRPMRPDPAPYEVNLEQGFNAGGASGFYRGSRSREFRRAGAQGEACHGQGNAAAQAGVNEPADGRAQIGRVVRRNSLIAFVGSPRRPFLPTETTGLPFDPPRFWRVPGPLSPHALRHPRVRVRLPHGAVKDIEYWRDQLMSLPHRPSGQER